MKYLGLDLGSKTLGIAISDQTRIIANIYQTIYFEENNYQSLIEPLKEIIVKENISKIILGLPKNMDNTLGERATVTLGFKTLLENNLKIEIILEDERLTSIISNNILIDADISRKKRKKKVDGLSAVLILQSYLDKERNGNNG